MLVCERLHTRSLKAVSATVDVTWPDHGLLAAAVSSPETQIHWSEHTCSSVEEKKKKKTQGKPRQFPQKCAGEESQMNKITYQLCNGIQFSMPSVHSDDIF